MLRLQESLRRPNRRLTYRARLALTYAVLLLIGGALMMAIVYIAVIIIPSYSFEPVYRPGITLPNETSVPEGAVRSETAGTYNVSTVGDLQVLILSVTGAVLLLLAIVGAVAGWYIAGRILRPLREVNAAASKAATGSLDHRLNSQGPHDEISELADTFDDMLDSLETSFHAHQRFAANASHELRTPLATTRAMLDVALHAAPPEHRETFDGLRAMNERSINTVDALLQLSDIEGAPLQSRSRVDLSAITLAVVRENAAEAAASHVGLHIQAHEEAALEGDPVLLHVLVDNLVKNAVKHNISEGEVDIRLVMTNTEVQLSVSNSGPLIPTEEVALLTEPLHQRAGRSRQTGHGLGLAIVASIVGQHAGTLQLAARAGGGLSVSVTFPRSASTVELPPVSRAR